MTPSVRPRNILVTFTGSPFISSATGVAEDTASTAKLDIALPKEISRKQRPARAGLMKFLPRPPKQHLQTSMANMLPSTGRCSGTDGDSDRASSRPVTAALPSFQVSGLWHSLSNTSSHSTAVNTLSRTTSSACTPKWITPTSVAGNSASSTTRMMKAVVHRSRTWGLEERFSIVFIFYLPPAQPARAFAP